MIDAAIGDGQMKARRLRALFVVQLSVLLGLTGHSSGVLAGPVIAAASPPPAPGLVVTGGSLVVPEGPLKVALIVGVNRSVDPKLPLLHYADDDAVRYEQLFRTVGTRTHLLLRADENTRRVEAQAVAGARDPRRGELTRAVAQIAGEVAEARAHGRRTIFYFIYAGHGSLNHGQAYLSLEDARLDGADIEHEIVDGVRADQSHLIIDACYSYFLAHGRGPGGSRREIHGFAPIEGLAHRSDVGLLLSTTSARESHEWEGFQAGVFSHEVRSGLFGAADFDGDGRVSYGEIAAFIDRANAAILNERFRPDVFARGPSPAAAQLLDLRAAPGLRHLLVDGQAQAGRYSLDDTRGVRLADFHNAPGHDVRLLLPADSGRLYLRRTRDDREFEIPTSPDVISLSELSPREPRSNARGAAHDAFSVIFALPFDSAAVSPQMATRAAAAAGTDQLPPTVPRPRWRTITGTVAAGVATVSLVGAAGFMFSARGLASDARQANSQKDAAALNERIGPRNSWARVGLLTGAAAAVTSALLFLLPWDDQFYGSGSVDAETAMVNLGGRF